jgi:hypothetical protein
VRYHNTPLAKRPRSLQPQQATNTSQLKAVKQHPEYQTQVSNKKKQNSLYTQTRYSSLPSRTLYPK